jgi:hypothetical protein
VPGGAGKKTVRWLSGKNSGKTVMMADRVSQTQGEYFRARNALLELSGVNSAEARALAEALYNLLGETDGWSYVAMLACTQQAEAMLSAQ